MNKDPTYTVKTDTRIFRNVTIEAVYNTIDQSRPEYGNGASVLVYCMDDDCIYKLYNATPIMQRGLHLFFNKIICSEIITTLGSSQTAISSTDKNTSYRVYNVVVAELYDILPLPQSFPRLEEDRSIIMKIWQKKDNSKIGLYWAKKVSSVILNTIVDKIQWRASILSYMERSCNIEKINTVSDFKKELEILDFSSTDINRSLKIESRHIDLIYKYKKQLHNSFDEDSESLFADNYIGAGLSSSSSSSSSKKKRKRKRKSNEDLDNININPNLPAIDKIARWVSCIQAKEFFHTGNLKAVIQCSNTYFDNMNVTDIFGNGNGNKNVELIESMQKCIENVKLRCSVWYNITRRANNLNIPQDYANHCNMFVHDSYNLCTVFWPRLAPLIGTLLPIYATHLWDIKSEILIPLCDYIVPYISKNRKLSITGIMNLLNTIACIKNQYRLKNYLQCWVYMLYIMICNMKCMNTHERSSLITLTTPEVKTSHGSSDNTDHTNNKEQCDMKLVATDAWALLTDQITHAYILYCIELKNEKIDSAKDNVTIIKISSHSANTNNSKSINSSSSNDVAKLSTNISEICKCISTKDNVIGAITNIAKLHSSVIGTDVQSAWGSIHSVCIALDNIQPDIDRDNKRIQLSSIVDPELYSKSAYNKGCHFSQPMISQVTNSPSTVYRPLITSTLLEVMNTQPQIFQIISSYPLFQIDYNKPTSKISNTLIKWNNMVSTLCISGEESTYTTIPKNTIWISYHTHTQNWKSCAQFWLQRQPSMMNNSVISPGFFSPLFNCVDIDYSSIISITKDIRTSIVDNLDHLTFTNALYLYTLHAISNLCVKHIKNKFDGSIIIIVVPLLLEQIIFGSNYSTPTDEFQEYTMYWEQLSKSNNIKICTKNNIQSELDSLDTISQSKYHIWTIHFEMFELSELIAIKNALHINSPTIRTYQQLRPNIMSIKFHYISMWGWKQYSDDECSAVVLASYMFSKYKRFITTKLEDLYSSVGNLSDNPKFQQNVEQNRSNSNKLMESVNLLRYLSTANIDNNSTSKDNDKMVVSPTPLITNIYNRAIDEIKYKLSNPKNTINERLQCLYNLLQQHLLRLEHVDIIGNENVIDSHYTQQHLQKNNTSTSTKNLSIYMSWEYSGPYSYKTESIRSTSSDKLVIIPNIFHIIASRIFEAFKPKKNNLSHSKSDNKMKNSNNVTGLLPLMKSNLIFSTDHSIPPFTQYDDKYAIRDNQEQLQPSFNCYFSLAQITHNTQEQQQQQQQIIKWIHPSRLWNILVHWPRQLKNIIILHTHAEKAYSQKCNGNIIDAYFSYWSGMYAMNPATLMPNNGIELFV